MEGSRWSKKSQKLVNIVCERPLRYMIMILIFKIMKRSLTYFVYFLFLPLSDLKYILLESATQCWMLKCFWDTYSQTIDWVHIRLCEQQ